MSTIRIGSFEWDSTKARTNLRKHHVGFDEAMECFEDPHGLELSDIAQPERLLLIAISKSNRLLTVPSCMPSASQKV